MATKKKVAIPQDSVLQQIAALAEFQVVLEQKVTSAELALSQVTAELREIAEEKLPNAMNEAHLKSFVLKDGREIVVSDEISLNISEKNKPALFEWLEKHGFGALIKRVVSVPFGKEDEPAANKLAAQLEKMKLHYTVGRTLHAGTAKSFVKEQLSAEKDVPLELFGAFPYQKSKIKPPKA